MRLLKFFRSKEWEILWPFYLAGFIPSLLFIFVMFYVVYFQQLGFSLFQIASFMAAMNFSKIIFEVPTGVVADLYGRKFSVILGEFLFGASCMAIFLTTNYYLIFLIFILMGLAITFSSGALEAWVTDLLKYKRKSNLLHNFFIRERSLYSLGAIFAGILSGLIIGYFGINSIWFFSGLGFMISGLIFLIFSKEIFIREKINLSDILKRNINHTKFSVKYILKHPILIFLVLAIFFLAFTVGFDGLVIWQPFLLSLNFPVEWFGYLISFGAFMSVLMPYLSKPFLKLIGKEKNYLAINFIFYAFAISLILFVKSWHLAILIFYLGCFIFDLVYPVENKYFQKHTLSKYRATITSFKSMLGAIGAMIGLLVGGFLADRIGTQYTIFCSIFFIIPTIVLYLMIKDKH